MKDSRWPEREFIDALRELLGLAPLYRQDEPSCYIRVGDGNRQVRRSTAYGGRETPGTSHARKYRHHHGQP